MLPIGVTLTWCRDVGINVTDGMLVCTRVVWSVGPKPVGLKSENNRAEILPHKAENRKAESTVRPKNSPLLAFYFCLVIALKLSVYYNSSLVSRLL